MSAPVRVHVPKPGNEPVVIYDFSQGRIAENLPPLARDVLRRNNFGTHRLEAELRNYLNYSGLTEVRPIRVLKIVSRYVKVRPLYFADMEANIGRRTARLFFAEVPLRVWWIQDFLEDLDIHRGYRMRVEIDGHIERGPYGSDTYTSISLRHLRRSGYNFTHVMRWIKEDPHRWNTWKRDMAKIVGVRA